MTLNNIKMYGVALTVIALSWYGLNLVIDDDVEPGTVGGELVFLPSIAMPDTFGGFRSVVDRDTVRISQAVILATQAIERVVEWRSITRVFNQTVDTLVLDPEASHLVVFDRIQFRPLIGQLKIVNDSKDIIFVKTVPVDNDFFPVMSESIYEFNPALIDTLIMFASKNNTTASIVYTVPRNISERGGN